MRGTSLFFHIDRKNWHFVGYNSGALRRVATKNFKLGFWESQNSKPLRILYRISHFDQKNK